MISMESQSGLPAGFMVFGLILLVIIVMHVFRGIAKRSDYNQAEAIYKARRQALAAAIADENQRGG